MWKFYSLNVVSVFINEKILYESALKSEVCLFMSTELVIKFSMIHFPFFYIFSFFVQLFIACWNTIKKGKNQKMWNNSSKQKPDLSQLPSKNSFNIISKCLPNRNYGLNLKYFPLFLTGLMFNDGFRHAMLLNNRVNT